MKLVDILARELREWPNCHEIFQDYDGELRYIGHPVTSLSGNRVEMCEDLVRPHMGAHPKGVTRAQWQEAREALSTPAAFPSLEARMCGIDMREDSKHSSLDNPPVGATHYIKGAFVIDSWWMREPGDNWYLWSEPANQWALDTPSTGQKNLMKPIHESLQKKSWNGEGLPPVGISVEVKNLDCASALPKGIEEWKDGDQVECIAHCIMQGGEHVSPVFFNKRTIQFSSLRKDCYQAIRTPEQIAAEEREKFIDELIKVTCIRRGEAGLIYDAGYRKVNDGNQKA